MTSSGSKTTVAAGTRPLAVFAMAVLLIAGCTSGDGDVAAEREQTTLADLNLGDGPLSSDLDPAEEQLIRDALAAEFSAELGVTSVEATCLSEVVAVGDLLEAGSAANGGDGNAALERVLQGFDECEIPRSVFERSAQAQQAGQ